MLTKVRKTMEEPGSTDPVEEDYEIVFYAVLDQVFSYLNARDLSRAARVSRTWRDTARRELSKRGPECLILPFAYGWEVLYDWDDARLQRLQSEHHVTNFVRARPEVGLFFTDAHSWNYDEPRYKIHGRFSDEFSYETDITVIETLAVCVNETEVFSNDNLTASIFLPLARMVDIRAVHPGLYDIERYLEEDVDLPRKCVDKLFPREHEHTCIIMFRSYIYECESPTPFGSRFYSEIISHMKERYKLASYSLWGGNVKSITKTRYNQDDLTPWIGISLSGPSLRSWSIALDCNTPNSDVEQKLLTLKKDVCLKSESLALMLVPSREEITSEEKSSKIDSFKKVFPTVPLVSLFSDQKYQFSFNSTSAETDQELCHTKSVAYLILSYN